MHVPFSHSTIKNRFQPVAYPGFQRGGCLRSGPIRKVGGGGSPLQVRYTKSVGGGGGGSPLQVPYTKSGGGAVHIRSDIRKVGGGGNSLQVRYEKWWGGPVRFRSDTFVWHTENTLSLIINGYNFDQGGGLKHLTCASK